MMLVEKIKRGDSEAAVQAYGDLVRLIVSQASRQGLHLDPGSDPYNPNDPEAASYVWSIILEAAYRWNPQRGTQFSTYCANLAKWRAFPRPDKFSYVPLAEELDEDESSEGVLIASGEDLEQDYIYAEEIKQARDILSALPGDYSQAIIDYTEGKANPLSYLALLAARGIARAMELGLWRKD